MSYPRLFIPVGLLALFWSSFQLTLQIFQNFVSNKFHMQSLVLIIMNFLPVGLYIFLFPYLEVLGLRVVLNFIFKSY